MYIVVERCFTNLFSEGQVKLFISNKNPGINYEKGKKYKLFHSHGKKKIVLPQQTALFMQA